ncbi:winged helix-turn-helix transcriptional regulator [Sphingobium phenoxybenzoativorans]|uniref:Winged helix-turn-helix transcriptional regulator n=1 Tax=Sphingobium phenoxybenzoativorans TaxID=1592790 RepID=A0A975K5N5_9SPHN|nr:MarR family winged helix-turn-helix transcriptional regulator [Sphingobium phenoxybenzoativorans]QUT05265.1 winged helix-turn-helix transcriptional regulator [Sphingobium phenoxybenzoativorans]
MSLEMREWSRGSDTAGRDDNWPFIGSGIKTSAGTRMQGDSRQILAEKVQRFCALRQDGFDGIIHDAPFNLLIDMFLSECKGRRVSVGDACLASRAPQTTALRAIQMLVDDGTIERVGDASDNRRKLLLLTAKGREQIVRFIDRFAALGGF